MNSLLNNQKGNKKYIEKEVKKMKRMCLLMLGMLFLIGGGVAFAADHTPTTVITASNTTMTVETYYNAYGVATMSIQNSSTTVTSTYTDEATGKVTTSTTTTKQKVTSAWKGGSIKVDSMTGTSETSGDDKSSAHTDFSTTYEYDELGRLKGGTGSSTTTGDEGEDKDGKKKGTYESETTNSYEIKNGQLLNTSSVTTGTSKGSDGKQTSHSTTNTNNTYVLIGGNWVTSSSETKSRSDGDGESTGSWTETTRTTTYQRDANGVMTGMSVDLKGTRRIQTGNGGFTNQTLTYESQVSYDPKEGYYVSWDKQTWA